MKSYSEIYQIIHDELGLTDLSAYQRYYRSFEDKENPRYPTPEEIAKLNPDDIDNKAFWEVAEEIFSTDAVSNCQFTTPRSKREAARRNLALYKVDGFIGWLECMEDANKKILEIGPGYGTLRQWIDVNTKYEYYGVDVYPKIDEIDESETNGLMGQVTKSRKYDVVISENVFQHLSVNQRRAYYRDVSEILTPNGYFMVSQMIDYWPQDSKFRDLDGKMWMCHYGQFTEIQKKKDVLSDLALYFSVEAETVRESWLALVCRKKF